MKENLLSFKKNLNSHMPFVLSFLVVCVFFGLQSSSFAYIAKRYTVPQIVKESSNIVFGTISVVNNSRKTVDIKVEKNAKGRSEFDVIKIRYDVYKGEVDHKAELARFLKLGERIIVCYLQEGGRIDALAHTRGKWFQLQLTRDSGTGGWGRWRFTHFEKYLNQDKVSRRNSTSQFIKELENMLGDNAIQLLFLNTDDYQDEIPIITEFNKVSNRWISYNPSEDRNLPGINRSDILWIGFRSIGREGHYRLNSNQEKRIRDFVKNGGVVIVSGQDSDPDRPCGTGWLPHPLKGVESDNRSDFKPTSKAGNLFKAPHKIRSGQLSLNDSWNGWNDKFDVLATSNSGKQIAMAKLRHGKGMYLITSLHNGRKEDASKNRRMLENILHFAVDFLEKSK